MTQPTLFPVGTAEKFETFHRDNPHVYRTLRDLAREWVNRTGRHKLGIATLQPGVKSTPVVVEAELGSSADEWIESVA